MSTMESEIEQALNRMKNNRREREENFEFSHQVDVREKENSHPLLRDKTKTRLQRLGVLYGGGEISSPIHKSEQTWEEEDKDINSGDKSPKAERRARRLQALANTINSWEDDMRHISPKKEQEERIDRFGNKVGSKAVKHETVHTPLKTQNGQTPKKVAWDRNIINTLEMQGYKRCESEEHLVYDYISPGSKECLSPTKNRNHRERSPSPKKMDNCKTWTVAQPSKPIEMKPPIAKSVVAQVRERSPVRSAVLAMAAQYESDSPSPTKAANSAVDPALLSVAEKKAVFERNRGTAPMPQQLPRPRAVSPPKRIAKPLALDTKPENSPVKDNVKQAMIERFQELEALRHRWDRNRAVMLTANHEQQEEEESEEETQEEIESQIPPPPPLPSSSYSSHDHLSRSRSPSPQIKMGVSSPVGRRSPPRQLPRVLSVKEKTATNHIAGQHYPEVKRIKVSPPKPGHLYPSISDIEVESEAADTDLETIDEEYMDEDDSDHAQMSFMNSTSLETSHSSESSFGRKIVRQASKSNLKRSSQSLEESSSSENESKILREMDNLLDEALGSPSPKKARDSLDVSVSESCSTNSFEFSEAEALNKPKVEPEMKTPLIQSFSFYRRQQNHPSLTPVRNEIRRELVAVQDEETTSEDCSESEEVLVQQKIKELTTEVQRQIETVSQASKALNLCLSTPGFTGSTAEIEAQKLLLVASARWTSLKQEIERLRVEKRLQIGGNHLDRGEITIQSISIPLKASYNVGREQSLTHVVCLVRSGCVVLQTEVISLDKTAVRNGCVTFQKILSLSGLYTDFTVSVEVYGFSVQPPMEHITDHKSKTTPKKDKSRSALAKKQKDKFPPIESPAGPNAVRSSGFQLWGFSVFSLREVNRTSFSLSKVPYTCPLEGVIKISMNLSMQSQVEHSGFMSIYVDINGFGTWKRQWAQLKGSSLAFWDYPENCQKGMVALDTIDLAQVLTVEADQAPYKICVRRNTILLESQLRGSCLPESLIVRRRGDITIFSHLLSVDTREEFLTWCKQINKVLHHLHAWKVNCATAV